MEITFAPLATEHFPLLMKWLVAPHVKAWWDRDVTWTQAEIAAKFGTYVQGYKQIGGIKKPMHAYIICAAGQPIGYSQYYNAHDFPELELHSLRIVKAANAAVVGKTQTQKVEWRSEFELPSSLAGMDMFIGEEQFLGKGIGTQAIKAFADNYIFPQYRYILVDPEYKNVNAVNAYENAGFVIIKRVGAVFLLVAHKKIVRLSTKGMIVLEVAFRQCFLATDSLWVFGSRADLSKAGGDIDLYIETNATTVDAAMAMKSRFMHALIQQLGEQKIDVVLNVLSSRYDLPIHAIAKQEGVKIL